MSNSEKAIVIGSGFGGLAAAVRLLAKGYQVEVIEAGNKLGGRARVFERDGYRFDAGPTVLTAPDLFDALDLPGLTNHKVAILKDDYFRLRHRDNPFRVYTHFRLPTGLASYTLIASAGVRYAWFGF